MEGLDDFVTPEEVPAVIVTENGVAAAPVEEDVLAPALVQDAEPAPPAPVAESSDPFLDHYQPAPAAAVAPAAPEVEDPRVAWRKKNQDELKAKDAEEAAAKKAAVEKAAAHLKKVQEARAKTLSARKDSNRAAAKASPEAGVPAAGTSWEKVNALVNFSAGGHTRDVTRFKTTLISLKTVKA